MIAETLRDGRRWIRSLQAFKPALDAMIEDGEVHRIAPPGGKARNQVELTGRGWRVYFGENLVVSRVDHLAELMAEGFEPVDAGRQLRLAPLEIAATLKEMRKHLGRQAA
jgi:hypothetical protein